MNSMVGSAPGFRATLPWRLLLAAIAALVVSVLGAGTVSATTLPELGNCVGAGAPVVVNIVGVHESISAGQRWGHAPPAAGTVVGCCVAAEGGSAAAEGGASRVARAAAMFGDDVVEVGRIVKTPFGTTDIDVVLSSGTFIEVGGPAKAFNPAKFGQQLQQVRAAADAEGGQALFMYEPGTPQSATDLATKGFGQGGARPIE